MGNVPKDKEQATTESSTEENLSDKEKDFMASVYDIVNTVLGRHGFEATDFHEMSQEKVEKILSTEEQLSTDADQDAKKENSSDGKPYTI